MPTNADYTREYFDIMESLGGDVESRRSAYDTCGIRPPSSTIRW